MRLRRRRFHNVYFSKHINKNEQLQFDFEIVKIDFLFLFCFQKYIYICQNCCCAVGVLNRFFYLIRFIYHWAFCVINSKNVTFLLRSARAQMRSTYCYAIDIHFFCVCADKATFYLLLIVYISVP